MEVSGRKPSKDRHKRTSDEDFSIYCQPCDREDKRFPAKGFCQDCQENLCDKCYTYHRIPTPCKNHVLLDVPQGGKQLTEKTRVNKCTIVCQTHTGKVVEFFCPVHDDVVCGVCAVLHHKSCKVDYVPDIAGNYKTSREYADLKDECEELEKATLKRLDDATTSIKDAEKSSKTVIDEIRKYRAEMNAYFDIIEKEAISQTKKHECDEVDVLKKVKSDCMSVKTEIDQRITNLTKVENKSSDLFVAAKQMKVHIKEIRDKLPSSSSTEKTCKLVFKREQRLEDIIAAKYLLGQLQKIPVPKKAQTPLQKSKQKRPVEFSTAQVSRLPDIDVKTPEDKKSSWITGVALLARDKLLVADRTNKAVKCVDTARNTVTSRLQMPCACWDIAVMSDKHAAVPLPAVQQIHIISTNNSLSLARTLDVKGKCFGIDATDDNLIVSFENPCKVEVMDYYGGILQTLCSDAQGKELFMCPNYVTVTREADKEVIFVSDNDKHTVTKLSLTGQVLCIYKDEQLPIPQGMFVTNDGQLLVCDSAMYKVFLVSPIDQKIKSVLSSKDEIEYPYSVCYCAETNNMYVGCWKKGEIAKNENTINVYTFK